MLAAPPPKKPPPQDTPPALFPVWSADAHYMLVNQGNHGELKFTIVPTDKVKSVDLSPGDLVALPDLPPGWKIAPDDTNKWGWTDGDGTAEHPPALIWNGPGTFTASDTPQSIALKVNPPTGTSMGGTVVNVELEQKDGTALTTAAPIVFNLMAPEPPLTAYADTSAFVLLASSTLPCYNTLDFTLRALSAVSSGTQLTLSFHGWDANHKDDVDLSASLDSIQFKVNLETDPPTPFTTNDNRTWTVTLPDMAANETLDVEITGLSISSTSLALLEARCVLGQITTSAWFGSLGPYTIGVAVDTTMPDKGSYAVGGDTSGSFYVYFVDGSLVPKTDTMELPLVWFNLNGLGQIVVPPVPSRFSLNGKDADEQHSENPFYYGKANTLCWLDERDSNNPKVIARCDINVVYLTPSSVGPFHFRGADFSEWNFNNWTNLGGSDFANANLAGTLFMNAPLAKCIMDGANINQANLYGAKLAGISFVGATLVELSMEYTDMSGCDFSSATVNGLIISGCQLDNSKFCKATLTSVRITHSTMTRVDLSDVQILSPGNPGNLPPDQSNALMFISDSTGMTLADASIDYCDISCSDFSKAHFSNITSSYIVINNFSESYTLPPGWSLVNSQFQYTGG